MWFSIDAVIKFITYFVVFVVEKSISTIAKWVNAFFRLLNVFTDSTFYVKRVIAFFLIGVAVFEEKSIRTQFGLGDSFNALVIEIALLGVRKKSFIFWTVKRWQVVQVFCLSPSLEEEAESYQDGH